MRTLIVLALLAATAAGRAEPAAETPILLCPAPVFDGTTMRAGWRVLVKGDRIVAAGNDVTFFNGSFTCDDVPAAYRLRGRGVEFVSGL